MMLRPPTTQITKAIVVAVAAMAEETPVDVRILLRIQL